jgi:hypothetical protein
MKAHSSAWPARAVRVALASAVLVLCLPPASGRAQTASTSAPGAPVGLHLSYQSPWVPVRGSFTMLLHVDNKKLAAAPGAAIAIRIYQSMTTRTDFDEAITNHDLGGILDQPDRLPVASLHRLGGPDGDLAVNLGTAQGATPIIAVNRAGVYPVEVSLTNTGVATSSFVTWLVVVDTRGDKPIDKKLMVSWVWQLVADPATQPDGSIDPGVAAQMKPGGRLDRIATLVGESDNFPVSLVVGPETVATWSQLAKKDATLAPGLARVRGAVQSASTDLLPVSYVPIDDTALEAAGLGGRLPEQFDLGARTLNNVLGASPLDRSLTAFVDPADDAAIDRLRSMLITRVAVRDAALTPATHEFTPAQGFNIDTASGRSQAVATAPFVERLLGGDAPSALKASRVIAALAEVAYETPAVERGLLLAPDARWTPDLATMNTLVAALRDFPLVEPVTLDDLLSHVSPERALGADLTRHLQPSTPPPPPVNPTEWNFARAELNAYESVVGRNDASAVAGEQALTIALSTSITPERAQAELAHIDDAVRAFTSAVTVDAKRITLTSRSASIPISFKNKVAPPRTLKVQVHLDSSKLSFPEGADQTVTLKPGATTVTFKVEARTSGTFPMTIRLTSEDGQLQFGKEVRVTVRSAVFGGIAVALTVGALVFLAIWWANHWRRTRRARRQANATS